MSDPSAALQVAIVSVLKADSAVAALVGDRIKDSVPDPEVFPYVTVGDGQVVGDDIDCADGSEVFFQCHVWSRKPGYTESKTIAGAIRSAIRTASITLAGFEIHDTQFVQSQYLKDPDGLTRHAVVEFRFLITHG